MRDVQSIGHVNRWYGGPYHMYRYCHRRSLVACTLWVCSGAARVDRLRGESSTFPRSSGGGFRRTVVRFVRFRSYITTRIRFPHVKLRKRRGSRAWPVVSDGHVRVLPTSGRCRFCNDVSRRRMVVIPAAPGAKPGRSQPRCDPRSESEMVRVQAHIGLAGRRKNESAQTAKRASACPDARSAPNPRSDLYSLNYH